MDTPTTPGGAADLRNIRAAAHSIAISVNGSNPVIVNKSTSPIGTGDTIDGILRRNLSDGDKQPRIVSNPDFLRQGHAVQDFLVEGLLHVLLDPTIDGEVFNLGNPAEITMLTLAEQILRLVEGGGSLEFSERRPGDPERRRPVIQKIQDRYGWTPTVDLEEGLRLTIAAFAAARGARPDPRLVGAQG